MKRPFSSVRTRLTLGNMIAVALILLCFAAPLHFIVHIILIKSVDRDLERAANISLPVDLKEGKGKKQGTGDRGQGKVTAALIHDPAHLLPVEHRIPIMSAEDTATPDILEFRYSNQHRFVGVGLFDLVGKHLPLPPGPEVDVWTRPVEARSAWDARLFAEAKQGKPIHATLTSGNRILRVFYKPIIQNGKVTAVVQAAYPMHEMALLLHGLDVALLLLIPVALFATGLSGAYLTGRAMRPVRQIAQAAAEVEASDLSRRLPVRGNDEFAELATTFNGTFARLEAAFARLEQSVELQRRFAADASHELRTPLTTIKAHTSWALRKERAPEAYRETLAQIDAAAGRMNRLIEDLLRLARADGGQLPLKRQILPAAEILRHAVAAAQSPPCEITVTVETAEPELCVCADPHHLERLFVNLLENAYRHTPPGGSVKLSAHRQEDNILFTVADTGEGISPEHLPFVCQRFYRIDSARARMDGGTGLGLAICQSIAQAHGGTLAIHSKPGQGTSVSVSLPKEG